MLYLLVVSTVWAFSFPLTKTRLAEVDPTVVTLVRLLIALVVFLPSLRLKRLSGLLRWQLLGLGALQFGVMYLAYHFSFRFLKAHEVALFTVVTPVYVVLVNDLASGRFRLPVFLIALAAAAAVLPFYYSAKPGLSSLAGFLLVQLSNLAFATGQILYKRLRPRLGSVSQGAFFAVPLSGAVLVAAVPVLMKPDKLQSLAALSGEQFFTLVYLGAVASGLCLFWWNLGVVRAAPAVVAVLNNLKIPAAVAVSMLIFGESGDPLRLLGCGAMLWICAAAASFYERRGTLFLTRGVMLAEAFDKN